LSRSPLPINNAAEAGFTLVEVLVALVVLTISLSAIAALASSSLRTGLYVERHLSEVETAQAILAALPARNELTDGSKTGVTGNYRWRIDAEPFPANSIGNGKPTRWSPQRIVVSVQAPTGETLRIETVRLQKKASP
jgi:general secretion pathway protein I